MANQDLESVLHETRTFPPRPEFVARARLDAARLKALRDAAAADHAGFWARLAHTEINWQKPFRWCSTTRTRPTTAGSPTAR